MEGRSVVQLQSEHLHTSWLDCKILGNTVVRWVYSRKEGERGKGTEESMYKHKVSIANSFHSFVSELYNV